MPPEGVLWKNHKDILSFEEIFRIVKIMAALGIRYIKVTGGEPLVRRGAALFIKQLKAIPGIEKVTLTTNGVLLGAYLDEVENMGLNALPDSINISFDALDRERYRRLTRCRNAEPETIISLIDRLLEKQITVKINCVPVRSVNEQEIIPIAALAKDKNIIVRFIELMPIGSAFGFQPVSGAEAAALIEKNFGSLAPFDGITGRGPAVYYSLADFTGKIGFINAVTHGFCETCNRLRLTSEGFLKLCLSNDLSLNLRDMIRGGENDNGLSRAVQELVKNKPRFHSLSNVYGATEKHSCGMSKIGG
jgi:cyclic pyranopterin phosphate synthase